MQQDDFKLDTTFTDAGIKWIKPAAIVTVVVLLIGIVLTITTNFAAVILPMDDEYLAALIPRGSDGAEPFSLKTLEQEIAGTSLTVRGSIENRADFTIEAVQAVIQPLDQYGLSVMPVEVAVDPPDVPAHSMATFQTTVTLDAPPSGYSVKFKLADGPFVPHKDERPPAAPSISIQPSEQPSGAP